MINYQIVRDVMGFISFFMGIFLFIKFFKISRIIDDKALKMVKQLKTMFGEQLVDMRIRGKDLNKIQKQNRMLIGKQIKSKTFGILDDIKDENVVASVLDKDLMNGMLWLYQKIGGGISGLLGRKTEDEQEGSRKKGKFTFT